MSYASLITEAADLASSMKAKADQIHKAAVFGAPPHARVNAILAAGELRNITRRCRRVLEAIAILDAKEREEEAARNAELAAQDAVLRARYGLPAASEAQQAAA